MFLFEKSYYNTFYCTSTWALAATPTPEHPPSVSFRQENKDDDQQRLCMIKLKEHEINSRCNTLFDWNKHIHLYRG